MKLIEKWNSLVALKRPKVQELRHHTDTWTKLRLDMDGIMFLGDNLVAMGNGEGDSFIPLTLICVFNPSLYEKVPLSPNVRFQETPNVNILGVPRSTSALAFVDALRRNKAGKVDLATISSVEGKVRYWEIIYGKALTLQFVPEPNTSKEPTASRLNTLSFAYQQPYTGVVPPTLT